VSLGGVAISAMLVFDIIGDISVIRRMFSVPEAYLYALTPSPRWKTLLSSVIVTAILDIVTMAVVITGEVWLSFILAGEENSRTVLDFISANASDLPFFFWSTALLAAGYLLVMMIILFCITARKSIFYRFPASGLLAFLLGCVCFYVVSLLQLALIPFSAVNRLGLLIILNLENNALPFYVLLTLLEAAALFLLTSKLMERRINL